MVQKISQAERECKDRLRADTLPGSNRVHQRTTSKGEAKHVQEEGLQIDTTNIAEMLDDLFARSRGPAQRFGVPAPVLLHWGRAVGPILARRTTLVRFVGTTLHVAAGDEETRRQLLALQPQLLGQLAILSGVSVKSLEVNLTRVRPGASSPMQPSRDDQALVAQAPARPPFEELPLVPLGTAWTEDASSSHTVK